MKLEQEMSISMCVLGSGSGGNSTVVRFMDDTTLKYYMVDVGFSPREIRKRLGHPGVAIEQIEGIFITHLHRDHFNDGWDKFYQDRNIPVYLHEMHLRLWKDFGRSLQGVHLFGDELSLEDGLSIQTVPLPHDQQGSVGYVFEFRDTRLGFATDLGHVPKRLHKEFRRLDALAFECNYDPDLQRNSRRPAYLKRRVMGSYGHLSNQQAIKAIQTMAEQSDFQHIVLLHRSQQCNTIHHIEQLVTDQIPHLQSRIRYTDQREPTDWFDIYPAEQGTHPISLKPQDQMELFTL